MEGKIRIGEFAARHAVTKDTVRHYIELGLLVPQKEAAQFYFDAKCSSDMAEILWLRHHRFSLAAIQRLLAVKRLTKFENEVDRAYYMNLYTEKQADLIRERDNLNRIIEEIDEKLRGLPSGASKRERCLGIPLEALSLLECPRCKESYHLAYAQVVNNMIMDGNLACSCGQLRIEDGILMCGVNFRRNREDEWSRTTQEYLERTAPEFVNNLYKTAEWMAKRISLSGEELKVVLEPGIGSGIMLQHIADHLPKNCCYLAVDHDIEILRQTKTMLEEYSDSMGVIFICCDFLDIPIKEQSVDIVLDYFGSTNYNFCYPGLLPDIIGGKVKPGGKWNGVFFCFDRESRSVRMYPTKCRDYFYLDYLRELLKRSSFSTVESAELGCLSRAGECEPFFVEGDNLRILAFYGQKTSG